MNAASCDFETAPILVADHFSVSEHHQVGIAAHVISGSERLVLFDIDLAMLNRSP